MRTNGTSEHKTEKFQNMQFQARDEEILNAIQHYGGVMTKRQLKELFWKDKTWRAMEKRLAKLYHDGYLDWPARDHWRSHPAPEPVCWLGWKGALLLASNLDVHLAFVEASNENKKRQLEQNLRKSGFSWLREPRWLQLKHDLKVVDFLMTIESAIKSNPSLTLGAWILEREFRSNPDTVEYEISYARSSMKRYKKAIIPDAFFSVHNNDRLIGGKPYTARFLVEIDMATEDNPRFGREKLLPIMAYLRSPEYEERFGFRSGRCLVVANTPQRLQHLKAQVHSTLGRDASSFWLTTFDHVSSDAILTKPVWYKGGSDLPTQIIES